MTEETTPAAPTFDLENWLLDAKLPQESCDVFKAGSVPAEASALKRRIELEREVDTSEQSAADKGKLAALERRYEEVLQEWVASKITVYVSALGRDAIRELRAEHDLAHEGKDQAVANEIFGYTLLAAAIVGIAEPDKEYVDEAGNKLPYAPVSLRSNQVRGLENKIGQLQFKKIMEARMLAQNALPDVDADFLLSSSGTAEENTAA